MSLVNLLEPGTKVTVSSTAPQTSKKALLTSSDECWTSTSLPSFVHLILPNPLNNVTHLALTFQGGFVATTISIYIAFQAGESDVNLGLAFGGKIYPEDKNKRQIFPIPFPPSQSNPFPSTTEPRTALEPTTLNPTPPTPARITELKLEFESSSDSHGRVTIYQLELLGAV
ncbi:hypothetical protein TREMEDRAFT_60640 [Tremella mesenterica DSM 1558]|uniref:uncharacterized protein n=1 Tax=Tremella mesenterica (strain ATCC 24925 / CBS 8224 / DSM 1558 / NBRC 9311 / NRRL Y-6157 / RJB 2259-6 / UBC 559-6) TaxID=578456 RepID=UPI0003F49464|nr:uncharacterized protein TREMEDRAFT_60640 [Tremella mesenterica DSM 1558]EIW71724.1 hypothetical protein TREMEDRAFT_60640 [Tremella mesenterica DSM 1558]